MSKICRAVTDAFTSCCYIKSSQWYKINIPILQMKKPRLRAFQDSTDNYCLTQDLCSGLKCESESRSVVSDSLRPHGLYSPWILQARILEWVAFPFYRDLPKPGIELGSPALLRSKQFQTSLHAATIDFPIISIYHGSLKYHKRDPFKLKWWGFLCVLGNWERSSSKKEVSQIVLVPISSQMAELPGDL